MIEGTTMFDVFNAIYPVGSIYMSVNDTNPSTLFGGSWSKIEGRVLVGVDSDSADYFQAGKTGGSREISLTTANLPAHNHTFSGQSATTSNNGGHVHQCGRNDNGNFVVNPSTATSSTFGYQVATGGAYLGFQYGTNSAGAHTHTLTAKGTIGNTGSGTPIDIMPPYYTVNIWRRTA